MKALITGVSGQDGSYLAEFLLSKGYEVHGLKRRSSSFNTDRVDDIYQDFHEGGARFHLHFADLTDGGSLARLLYDIRPDEVYNLGAQSHVKVSFAIPEYTVDVAGSGALRLLEAIRQTGLRTRFSQASSSEMFGSTSPPQAEASILHPRSPYACAKVFAHNITVNYRESYGLHASCGTYCSITSRLAGARRLSPARSRAPSLILSSDCRRSSTWVTSTPPGLGIRAGLCASDVADAPAGSAWRLRHWHR